MALSGTIRDLVNAIVATARPWGLAASANGYLAVYALEILLLMITIVAIVPLIGRRSRTPALARRRGPAL
jgi:BCD family chlorophyll transporter-like MFS transporter